jgi:cell division protein FtsN
VQAASYKSLAKAEELKATLLSSGMTAAIFAASVSGESVYRVRIGPYRDKEEAERWMLVVRKIEGLESSFVTAVSGT